MARRPRSGGAKRLAAGLGVALVVGAVVWGYGLLRFVDLVPGRVADETTRTEAIVVLTGGSQRLGTGLDLLSRGLAAKLFVSGVYQGVDVRQLLQIATGSPRDLETRIGIGNATNTAGNASETTAWVRAEGYSSLRLVTAAYHMPRSLLEFRHAMPDVDLVPHPVFPENVKHHRWWAWPGTASLMISEYNKYLFAGLRHAIRRFLAAAGVRAPEANGGDGR